MVCLLMAIPHNAIAQRFATSGPYNTPAGKSPTAELIRDIGIDQHLNSVLPLDLIVCDEQGRQVRLADYFTDKPVVLALVQYRCPMLCNQVLNGFLKASQAVPLEVGRDYHFVAISFDPREGQELAKEKKDHYARVYRRPGGAHGFHFLTADQSTIDQITQAVGFRYRYMPHSDQFAHASGLIVVTPNGRISRYLYGIEFAPTDLRLSLIESANHKIGSMTDQVLLLCYHYDPLTGKYGVTISRVMRFLGVVTISILGGFLIVMVRAEQRRPKLVRPELPPLDTALSFVGEKPR